MTPPTRSRLTSNSRSGLSWLLLSLVLVGGGLQAEPPPPETPVLHPGSTAERDIGLGETHEFLLPISAGAYLDLEVLPTGVEIEGSLLDPSGTAVATLEGEEGSGGAKLLAWVSSAPGPYRLRIKTRGSYAVQAHYELKVRNLRSAEPEDATRVEAARKLAESRRLRDRQPDGAENAAREALSLWRSAGDGPGEVEALSELGSIFVTKREYPEALRWHEKALERAREIQSAAGIARSLINLGNGYRLNAEPRKAIASYQEARDRWRELGNASEEAFALQGLGKAYLDVNDNDAALESFRAALERHERSREVLEQAHDLSGIGAVHFGRGNIGECFKTYERALELSRSAGDQASENLLENNLGAAYYRYGQLQKAVGILTRLTETGSKDLGLYLYNLGAIYLELGDLEKALDHYRRSVDVYRRTGSPQQVEGALVGVGTTLQRMGKPREALLEYQEARKLTSARSWEVSHHEGLALVDLGKPGEGLSRLRQALAIARETHNRASEAATLLAMGVAHRALGEPDQASDFFAQAIRLGIEIEYPSVVPPALLQGAMVRRDQGRLEEARESVEKALEIIESTRRNIAGQQIRTSYLASKRMYYEFYIDLLMKLDQLHPEGGYKALALEASERGRSRGLLDLLAEGRIDVDEGISPELREREGRIAFDLKSIQDALGSGRLSAAREKELKDQLADVYKRQVELEWDIREQNPRYARVRYPNPLKTEEIRGGLDEETALLEYAIGKERSTLFVLTRGKLSSYPLPSAAEIARQAGVLRGAVERESLQTRKAYLESASQLYRMLVEPAVSAGALAGKKNLLIVPDRDLYYIPFETLLTRADAGGSYADLPYLLRQYAISYVPSASVLAGLRQPRPAGTGDSRSLVAFAPFAPPAGAAAQGAGLTRREGGQSFRALPASRQEVFGIGELYPGSALEFVGDEATEDNVKRNPAVAAARRLHFATHAQLDERYPEYSSLILARSPSGQEDGYLRVQEIFGLKLSADLVVLSACQTALGKEVTGEGLIGLTRAFFYAGAPSLVVSLWNVIDAPTPDLMLDLYTQMDSLHDKSRSLQKAKLDLISRRPRYAHPSFWAPFILIGEPK